MTRNTEVADALNKVSIAIKAICDRMERLDKCMYELTVACQSMSRNQIKQTTAIASIQKIVWDVGAPKND